MSNSLSDVYYGITGTFVPEISYDHPGKPDRSIRSKYFTSDLLRECNKGPVPNPHPRDAAHSDISRGTHSLYCNGCVMVQIGNCDSRLVIVIDYHS